MKKGCNNKFIQRWAKLLVVCLALAVVHCKGINKQPPAQTDASLLHRTQQVITAAVITDVFNPPVSSRIYAYTSLAGYEAVRHATGGPSLAASLNGFAPMPSPGKASLYYPLAAAEASLSVAEKVIFSTDSLQAFRQQVLNQLKEAGLSQAVIDSSLAFGKAVAAVVLQRADADNYKQTRAMPRYTVLPDESKWQPTGPEYADAVEASWQHMKPLFLHSASALRPAAPLPFSKDTASAYYKELKEVQALATGCTNDQKHTALFWDDNPFVTAYSGHLTRSNKKMTPAGHWMAIAGLASQKKGADAVQTARAYALTAAALYDGFIACWEEKFHRQTVRPITLIHAWMDPGWKPLLQTPPFPEYPSGHSVISAAAAEVLTALYGDNFAYTDTTELPYDRGQRSFRSFREAALESSISRVYGGIHFRSSVVEGNRQGIRVGQALIKKLEAAQPPSITKN